MMKAPMLAIFAASAGGDSAEQKVVTMAHTRQ